MKKLLESNYLGLIAAVLCGAIGFYELTGSSFSERLWGGWCFILCGFNLSSFLYRKWIDEHHKRMLEFLDELESVVKDEIDNRMQENKNGVVSPYQVRRNL